MKPLLCTHLQGRCLLGCGMIQWYLETTSNVPLSSACMEKAKETIIPKFNDEIVSFRTVHINQNLSHTNHYSDIPKQVTRVTRSLQGTSLRAVPRPGRTKGMHGNTPLLKSWHSEQFVLRSSLPAMFCHLRTQAQKSVLKQHHSNAEQFT